MQCMARIIWNLKCVIPIHYSEDRYWKTKKKQLANCAWDSLREPLAENRYIAAAVSVSCDRLPIAF